MSKNSAIMTSLAKRAGVIALSATLSVAAFAGTAYAYFTSHTQAAGSHPIELGYSSEIEEGPMIDGVKRVTMKNTGTTDIMVRVQLFYGTGINGNIDVTPMADGTDSHWKFEDGIYWWEGVLEPGDSTGALVVTVDAKGKVDLSDFDVTVIGQTSPVYYDENGKPVAYLWTNADPNGGTIPVSQPDDEN